MLKTIVDSQINKQVKPRLGKISQPSIKPISFQTKIGEVVPEGSTLQWGKRSYVQTRTATTVLEREDFLNYSGSIPKTTLSPSVTGSLIDSNLPTGTNIEYAVEVFTLASNSQPTFNITVGGGSRVNIYKRIRTGLTDNSSIDYTTSQIANGVSNGNISLNLIAGQWTTILVYLYSVSDGTYIRGFSNLMSIVDSWRLPDVIPPSPPTWADIPLVTGSDSVSGQSYNEIRWKFPNDNDLAGNGIYFYSEDDTGYDVVAQNPDPNTNGVITTASTSDALQDFPSGSSMRPNSNYNYTPSKTTLIMGNGILNNTFTDTSGANSWDYWTQTLTAGRATVKPTFSTFYTNGASICASTDPVAAISTYFTYDNTVSVSTSKQYRIFLNYKTEDYGTSVSYMRLNYYDTADSPCSTAYQMVKIDNNSNWVTTIIKVKNTTSPSYAQVNLTTTDAFKLPSNCSKVKPVIYFHYSTSISSKFYLDSIKFSEYKKGDQFSTDSSKRVMVSFSESLVTPDTPYCDFHCDYSDTINDTYRSVTGTLTGTAVYVSSAFFGRFSSSICLNNSYINYIKNGHFSDNTSDWNKNSLSLFATSLISLFGAYGLKIGCNNTTQYLSQDVSLSGDDIKSFSFYSKPSIGDGVRVLGMLSGATQFDYSQNYSTSNWQRFLFDVSTVDSLRIYPYYNTSYFGGYGVCYIDGVQLASTSASMVKHPPYFTTYIDGVSNKGSTYISYSDSLINTAHGTMEFWVRPQNIASSDSHITVFKWATSVSHNKLWSLSSDGDKWSWYMASNISGGLYKQIYSSITKKSLPNELIHLAITWGDSGGTLYVNGVKSTAALGYHGGAWDVATSNVIYTPDIVGRFIVGAWGTGQPYDSLNGYLDAMRIESCAYEDFHIRKDYEANMMNIKAT